MEGEGEIEIERARESARAQERERERGGGRDERAPKGLRDRDRRVLRVRAACAAERCS